MLRSEGLKLRDINKKPDASTRFFIYGAKGVRTLDLSVANAALSQLSYDPAERYYTIYSEICELFFCSISFFLYLSCYYSQPKRL